MMKKISKKEKNKKLGDRGITLIALIVTIIVLLILAGVSIAVLTGENGILNRATSAKQTHEEKTAEEELRLGISALTIDYRKNTTNALSFRDYVMENKQALANAMGVNANELTMDSGSYSITYKGQVYIVGENGGLEPFRVIALTGFNIKETAVEVQQGKTKQLTIENKTPNDANEQILWESSNTEVATVDANGVVRGIAAGSTTATITATSASGGATSSTNCVVTVTEAPAGPIAPVVNKGSYVTWNGTSESTSTTAPSNNILDDYENGRWWNLKTTENEINCYWVWIPRFAYIVSDVQNSSAKQIDVQLVGTNVTGTTTIDNKQYLVHPAFTFGTGANKQELAGFWVAKFEASAYNLPNNVEYGGGNTTSYKVQVLPGVQSWRNIATTNIFSVCQDMTATGGALVGVATNIDSHMMKNSEWGAVAILSQSKYGIYNTNSLTRATANGGDGTLRVWTNPNGYGSGATIMTGYVGESADAKTEYNAGSAVTSYLWNDITHDGPKASTTGTIYGVYDMAGGSWEYVAGLYSTNNTGLLGSNIDTKYYDVNADASSDPNKTLAITNNWNTDYSNFAYSFSPVFRRGGDYRDGGLAGVFASNMHDGGAHNLYSFRPVWVAP